jgi:Tfp pilus assembly protein PilP
MKMAIKLTFKVTTGILLTALMAGAAWAQTPDAAQAAKPQPGAPAPAVKPAVIPTSQPTAKPAAKPAAKPVAKPAAQDADNDADSGPISELKSVKVTHSSGDIQIELNASGAVTPRVSKLDSPSRLLVELPETSEATPQNHIAVGSGGVKGVRIGMNGKTPPTTSVVVDLEKDIAYELTPGSAGKFILTLHTGDKNTAAKSSPAPEPMKAAPVKTQAAAPVVQAQAKAQPVVTKPQAAAPAVVAAKTTPAPQAATLKTVAATGKMTSIAAPAAAAKTAPVVTTAASSAQSAKPETTAKPAPSVEALKGSELPKPEDKKWAMTGKRDPFFSPVVQAGGSGCSTGKKCLEIGQINLRGVVKSENGFIAVVTNTLNKAYFLRENDPVFNGYVVKITGDSVVFQETVQDKLGKTFTREVVKKIFTPAV